MSKSETCPYDGDSCAEKQQRLNSWEKAVARLADNRINSVICTSTDIFDGCARYKRYLYMAKQSKVR